MKKKINRVQVSSVTMFPHSMEGTSRTEMVTSGPQTCPICNKICKHYFALKCHVVKVHPKMYNRFKHGKSGQITGAKSDSSVAKQSAMGGRKCPFCLKQFKHSWAVKCHVVKQHPNVYEDFVRKYPTQPPVSKRKLRNRPRLRARRSVDFCNLKDKPIEGHLLQDADDADLEPIGQLMFCPVCEDKFYDGDYLRWHVKTEHDSNFTKPPMVLTNRSNTSDNSDILKSGDPAPPQLAPWFLEGTNTNNSHKLVHNTNGSLEENKSPNFDCKRCTTTFSDIISYKRHLSSHSVVKVYKCPKCDYRCLSIQQREKHLSNSHCEPSPSSHQISATSKTAEDHRYSENLKMACMICSKMLQLKSIVGHIKHVHSNFRNSLICNYCKEELDVSEIPRHTLHHARPHECNVCRKRFETKHEQERHEKIKHFSPRSGVKSRDHPCPYCDNKSYFHESSLIRHVLLWHPSQQ